MPHTPAAAKAPSSPAPAQPDPGYDDNTTNPEACDIVDRLFALLAQQPAAQPTLQDPQAVAAMKAAMRIEFGGEWAWVRSHATTQRELERRQRVHRVLELVQTMHISEVARVLQISRTTVRRIISEQQDRLGG